MSVTGKMPKLLGFGGITMVNRYTIGSDGVTISQIDFVYLMTQLDAIEILLREDNFKMYSRSSLEKMVITLKKEFEKYLSNVS